MQPNHVRLPNGNVVPRSSLDDGWECERCDGFVPAEPREENPGKARLALVSTEYIEGNGESNPMAVNKESTTLCEDCATELRAFLGLLDDETPIDHYQLAVRRFAESNDLTAMKPGTLRSQWNVVDEEFEELQEAYEQVAVSPGMEYHNEPLHPDARQAFAEEAADLVYAVHLMAFLAGVDLRYAFRSKAEYNSKKSGERDESGKIIDDVTEEQ